VVACRGNPRTDARRIRLIASRCARVRPIDHRAIVPSTADALSHFAQSRVPILDSLESRSSAPRADEVALRPASEVRIAVSPGSILQEDVRNAEDQMSGGIGRNGSMMQISTRERTWSSPLPLDVCLRRLQGATTGRVAGHFA
jgi:hypothetical protein